MTENFETNLGYIKLCKTLELQCNPFGTSMYVSLLYVIFKNFRAVVYGLQQVIFILQMPRVNKFTLILLNLCSLFKYDSILILQLSPTRTFHDVVLLITLSTVRPCIINLKSVTRYFRYRKINHICILSRPEYSFIRSSFAIIQFILYLLKTIPNIDLLFFNLTPGFFIKKHLVHPLVMKYKRQSRSVAKPI